MTPPAAAAAPATRRGRVALPGRPPMSPSRPRRVSGPARRASPPPHTPTNAAAEPSLVLGLLSVLRRLSHGRVLDRLITGRLAIAVIAFALIGIVTLQLGMLDLNAGIGRALQRTATLQTQNASLSVENSELAAGERVENEAFHLGMQPVPEGALRFLSIPSHGGDAGRAAAALGAAGSASAGAGEQAAGASATTSGSVSESASGSAPASSSEAAPQGGPEASTAASQSADAASATDAAAGTPEAHQGAGGEPSSSGASSDGAAAAAPTAAASPATPAPTAGGSGGSEAGPTG